MDFPDKARRTERSAPRKSLVERAAAILDNTARASEPPRASNAAAAAAVPAPSAPAYIPPPPPPIAHAPLAPATIAAPAVAPIAAPAPVADADSGAGGGKRVTRKQIELNFGRLRERGFVVPGDRSTTAEEIRLIKRTLLRQAFSDGRPQGTSHLIMVTSARPSEGKTFMAINLALSMALEKDITVLLIDADVAQPAVPGVLGFESDRGLLDLLVDPKLDMSEVMIRTNIETLSILPAGRDMPNANELLASAKMEALVDDIARRYPDRVIIFDTPPVLVRTETSVLAAHVGQVAFVIEAEHTNETAVKESLELLNGCGNIGLDPEQASFFLRDRTFWPVLRKIQAIISARGADAADQQSPLREAMLDRRRSHCVRADRARRGRRVGGGVAGNPTAHARRGLQLEYRPCPERPGEIGFRDNDQPRRQRARLGSTAVPELRL